MARMRTQERKREREREQRRRRLMIIAGVVIAIVVVLVLFFFIANQPADAPIPPEALTRYDGLDQRLTQAGYPRIGESDAPVQVSLYCTFSNTECADFHDGAIDPLVQRVRDGSISLTFVPLYFPQEGNSQGAARAALCAAEQQSFWTLQDSLYSWLRQFGVVQAFTNNRLNTGIGNLNLNRQSYDACLSSGAPNDTLAQAASDQRGLVNFTALPAVTIDNVLIVNDENVQETDAAAILAAIDEAIAGRGNRPESTEVATEAVESATEEATEAPAAEPTTAPTHAPTDEPAADTTVEATEAE